MTLSDNQCMDDQHMDDQSIDDISMESIIIDNISETHSTILTKENMNTDIKSLDTGKYSIHDELRRWAIECNIQHNHLDKLLHILRKELITDLPKCSKTFLGTHEAKYKIIDMEDADKLNPIGQFIYFNIKEKLLNIINEDLYQDNVIRLLINVDGMPISLSGTKSFWAILCKIYYHLDVYKPFVVALYYGKSKPKFLDKYLEPFIHEINILQKDGIIIGKNTYQVQLMAFISDTPARAFLKCIKGHGGYNACERCIIRGELFRTGKSYKVIYPGAGYSLRTKKSFIMQRDEEHHNGISPLLNIVPAIDMTKIFVLDHMHLFFNGVMKKLIDLWMKHPSKIIRLTQQQKMEISRKLLSFRIQIPTEFQRKPRSIYDYLKWKATEFRFFLLYCGPVVLTNILSRKLYHHFLLLHVACRILCNDQLALTHKSIAKKYLKKFVLALSHLYGPQYQVINMHNLLHVADDVTNFNCSLSKISCFPFENVLGEIKRLLRTPNKPLSQVCRRLYEKDTLANKEVAITNNEILTKVIENGKIYIKKIVWNFMTITTKRRDNMVLLNNNIIMKINSMYCDEDNELLSNVIIEGKVWTKYKLLYTYPCKSNLLKTWQLLKKSQGTRKYLLRNVSQKLVRLQPSKSSKFSVIPLLHYL